MIDDELIELQMFNSFLQSADVHSELFSILDHSISRNSVGLGRVLESCSVKPVESIVSLRTLAKIVGEHPKAYPPIL